MFLSSDEGIISVSKQYDLSVLHLRRRWLWLPYPDDKAGGDLSHFFSFFGAPRVIDVIEQHDVDRFELPILYQFVIAGVLPHEDILKPRNHGENMLKLADYLLVNSFKDYLQTHIFCAAIPRFPFNKSVIRAIRNVLKRIHGYD